VRKRIFLDIETLPPDESFRENLAGEIYAEQGPGELGPGEAEIDVEVERRFRDLALRGEMNQRWSNGSKLLFSSYITGTVSQDGKWYRAARRWQIFVA